MFSMFLICSTLYSTEDCFVDTDKIVSLLKIKLYKNAPSKNILLLLGSCIASVSRTAINKHLGNTHLL